MAQKGSKQVGVARNLDEKNWCTLMVLIEKRTSQLLPPLFIFTRGLENDKWINGRTTSMAQFCSLRNIGKLKKPWWYIWKDCNYSSQIKLLDCCLTVLLHIWKHWLLKTIKSHLQLLLKGLLTNAWLPYTSHVMLPLTSHSRRKFGHCNTPIFETKIHLLVMK